MLGDFQGFVWLSMGVVVQRCLCVVSSLGTYPKLLTFHPPIPEQEVLLRLPFSRPCSNNCDTEQQPPQVLALAAGNSTKLPR